MSNKKEELLFIWIKEYKKLKNIGFNLSNRYRFSYNPETKRLTREESENYPDDYFPPPISNFTAVIGANGVGKTSLIKFILYYFTEGNNISQIPAIVITKIGESLIISHSKDIEINEDDKERLNIDASALTKHPGLTGTTLVYHTNFYDPFLVDEYDLTSKEFQGLINLSTGYLISSDRERYENAFVDDTYKELINAHIMMEYKRQVNFLCDVNSSDLLFQLPRYLIMRINFKAEEDFKKSIKGGQNSNLTPLISGLEASYKYFTGKGMTREALQFNVFRVGFLSIIKDYLIKPNSPFQKYLDLFLDNIPEYIFKGLDKNGLFNNFTNFKKFLLSKIEPAYNLIIERLNYLGIIIMGVEKSFKNVITVEAASAYVDLSLLGLHEKEDLLKFISEYFGSLQITSFLDFAFSHEGKKFTNFSSGELALLSIFSRLYWIKSEKANLNSLKTNLLFILDEAEMALHPRWQRAFIAKFVDFVKKCFGGFNVQILLTSHSPFIISDLPPHNIIYLKDEDGQIICIDSSENKNTLGANIHELLSDSFFMDNILVGEYAINKINNVIQILKDDQPLQPQELDNISKFIESLGEPFIQSKLKDMLKEKIKKHQV